MASTPPDVSKRDIIGGTLKALKAKMPDDSTRAVCDRFTERLHYTAPEQIDRRWAEIHEFLRTQFPDDAALKHIWNEASAQYRQV